MFKKVFLSGLLSMAMVFSMGLGVRAEVRAIEEESFCRELHDDYKRKEDEKINRLNKKENLIKEAIGFLEKIFRNLLRKVNRFFKNILNIKK